MSVESKSQSDHHFSENQGKNTNPWGIKHPLVFIVGTGVFFGTAMAVVSYLEMPNKNKDFALTDPHQKLPVITKTIKREKEDEEKV